MVWRKIDFETVFPRVARTGDEAAHTSHVPMCESIIPEVSDRRCRQVLQDGKRLRALNGELRIAITAVLYLRADAAMTMDMFVVRVLIACIHAQQVVRRGHTVDEQIVHKGPGFGHQS